MRQKAPLAIGHGKKRKIVLRAQMTDILIAHFRTFKLNFIHKDIFKKPYGANAPVRHLFAEHFFGLADIVIGDERHHEQKQ